mmetsp:Transcript_78211/g.197452  ORF Transcript_78211/g.197452 Transcript_78211/m.197452 type:complete len:261 (+) Transcript_78211:620-1402(+)
MMSSLRLELLPLGVEDSLKVILDIDRESFLLRDRLAPWFPSLELALFQDKLGLSDPLVQEELIFIRRLRGPEVGLDMAEVGLISELVCCIVALSNSGGVFAISHASLCWSFLPATSSATGDAAATSVGAAGTVATRASQPFPLASPATITSCAPDGDVGSGSAAGDAMAASGEAAARLSIVAMVSPPPSKPAFFTGLRGSRDVSSSDRRRSFPSSHSPTRLSPPSFMIPRPCRRPWANWPVYELPSGKVSVPSPWKQLCR